ncbi:MAG TPA: response regulator transcription factor [Candidatus Limnocylindria bacterium]
MRILIVEDDRRLAASLRRGLEEAGLAVDAVHDGEDGLAGGLATPYDVILLDVMLPGLDGFAVCRQLRDRRIKTPVLMLTARDAVDDRVRGLEAGADDYLVKPFALRELIARIRALARRHLPDRSAALVAGRVSLDTGAHLLRVDGTTVDLTAKEFAILEHLLLNRGRVVTRSQLLESVWDYEFDGGRNLVEVYIGRIRRKIGDANGGDPIITVRGSGYRYAADDELGE